MGKRGYPQEEVEPWRDWYGKPGKKRSRRIRRLTLTQALVQAGKQGLTVWRTDVAADGSFSLRFGEANAAKIEGQDNETADDVRRLI